MYSENFESSCPANTFNRVHYDNLCSVVLRDITMHSPDKKKHNVVGEKVTMNTNALWNKIHKALEGKSISALN